MKNAQENLKTQRSAEEREEIDPRKDGVAHGSSAHLKEARLERAWRQQSHKERLSRRGRSASV
eukprot:1978550-Rhodomonas_salina.2